MHTNHRRKAPRYKDSKWCNTSGTMREYRKLSWEHRRAAASNLIRKGRFDELKPRYFRNIHWNWF